MHILYFVDTIDYVKTNCFQHQLYKAFERTATLTVVEVGKPFWTLRARAHLALHKPDRIVSVVRQRVLNRLLSDFRSLLNGREIRIYEQDPWESYIDGGAALGFYKRLPKFLNAMTFVTSRWWSDKLKSDGVNASWVRMGMDSVYCEVGPKFNERLIPVGFRGAFYDHRVKAFEEMEQAGVSITFERTRVDYEGYMKYLHTTKIFTHDESGTWQSSEGPIPRWTGIHIKDIETAARGAFVLRNACPDDCGYEFHKIPTILFYDKPSNAKQVIDRLYMYSDEEIFNMQKAAVAELRGRDDWYMAARHIIEA
jgi:hypothetical protein